MTFDFSRYSTPMASSSTLPRTWRYRVFTSFHGPDVRKTFLSHLRKQFSYNGISMFDDQEIERSHTIAPALVQAIVESRISIVVLSMKYASSSWCLDELLRILKCQEDMGQIVMTVFYGVDPSDVRKQTGEFGNAFNETCTHKTEEEKQKWSQALTYVGNIAGEHFLNWDKESKMVEKIARDVSNKLNTTISKDFEDMVGIEAHLQKMQTLLHLECEDEAMIVGICGPSGIGKTTIARALHSRLSSSFQLTCFMENLKGSYNSGLDEYGLKLCLQQKLLSKILNQNDMKIFHLGAIPERLYDQKVLIILDDVDDLQQLEALANEVNWFGPGSRIIVTTEDQELLEQHDINNTYHVDFPTIKEARKIFCRYAFRQSFAPYGFEKLVERVIILCSNLPLGLRVMGSSLRRKKKEDWESILHRLEDSLDRKIEKVLRVGYDNLHKNDQFLFLLIAFFLNNQDDDHVKTMLGDSNLDVRYGLKTLRYKSLIQISSKGDIVMHKLLQQVGKEVVQRQDHEKRQILIGTDEICDVLENDSGSRSVMGISFDISTLLNDVYISAESFKRIRNLRFLKIYKTRFDTNVRVHLSEDMDFPPRLRLLHWEVYPGKCLPRTFRPEYLVELNLRDNQLEKLWEGIQPLKNLKKMELLRSNHLKELPDLSDATNLVVLNLARCESLVEIPPSIGNLHKLELLDINFCRKLQVVPTHFNLTCLESLQMMGCWQLKNIPDISTNITRLSVTDTMLEDLSESVRLWSGLQILDIYGSVSMFPVIAEIYLEGRGADIEKIPDCIKDLDGLKELHIYGCPKIASLPKLPSSLKRLIVDTCESLESLIPFPFESHIEDLYFSNCFKLGQETRRVITQQSRDAWLPGKHVPSEFDHRAVGNSLTVLLDTYECRICVVISPNKKMVEYVDLLCRQRKNGFSTGQKRLQLLPKVQSEHLFIGHFKFSDKLESGVLLEFSTSSNDIDVIECGIRIFDRQSR